MFSLAASYMSLLCHLQVCASFPFHQHPHFCALIGLQQEPRLPHLAVDSQPLRSYHTLPQHTHTNGSPLPTPVLSLGTMPLMPLPNNSIVTKLPAARQRYPHPFRSAEDIMAEKQPQEPQLDSVIEVFPQHQRRTILFSRAPNHSRTIQRRSIRSSGDGSDQIQILSAPQMARAVFSTQKGFGYSAGAHAATASQKQDYPVIPTRPPLRPTNPFGIVSNKSDDSMSSVWDEKIPFTNERDLTSLPPPSTRDWRECVSCAYLGLLKFIRAGLLTSQHLFTMLTASLTGIFIQPSEHHIETFLA